MKNNILEFLRKYILLCLAGMFFLIGTILFVCEVSRYYSLIYFFHILIVIGLITIYLYCEKKEENRKAKE